LQKLLLIDDDPSIAIELKKAMLPHEWIVETADNGKDALQLLRNFSYDIILLDWNMPGPSGLDVCRTYRASGGLTPIIFLTGRDELDSKEAGLDSGADDYLTKPFETRELLARIRSIKRRSLEIRVDNFEVRGMKFDPKLRTATFNGKEVVLSPTESNILEFILRHRDEYTSAAQIFASVWPSDSETSEDTVRVCVKFLRTKLAKIGADHLLETVKKAGYIIRSSVEKNAEENNANPHSP
jgi:OmpR-family two-component system manganese-sensing response regulator